ncbi:MAG: hypothetical protein IJU82_03395 [Ruminiclostridium sp.]|jgi:hypothetical protein|nr:hypothetical protein [Ruminiclostridium sp.]
MDALVYTKDDTEFEKIETMFRSETEHIDLYRDPLNGHSYFSHDYNIVVIALNGAQGMELVLEYSRRFDNTLVIWITDDPYFAGTAIRQHIYEFIERPYDDTKLRKVIKSALRRCADNVPKK